jgi:transposase
MTSKKKQSTEAAVREIRRRTRRKFAPEEKVRIVLEGLRGEQNISELCRREGIAANLPPWAPHKRDTTPTLGR